MNLGNIRFREISDFRECDIFDFSGVDLGFRNKKSPRDSTLTYSPWGFVCEGGNLFFVVPLIIVLLSCQSGAVVALT